MINILSKITILILALNLVNCKVKIKQRVIVSDFENETSTSISVQKATVQKITPGQENEFPYFEVIVDLEQPIGDSIVLLAMVYNDYQGKITPSDIKENHLRCILKKDETLLRNISRPLTIVYLENNLDKTLVIKNPEVLNDIYKP